jgi:ribosomal protein S18 acetylase RimI-like enzyme
MKAIDLEVEAGHERAANLYRREGFTRFQREHWRLEIEPHPRRRP